MSVTTRTIASSDAIQRLNKLLIVSMDGMKCSARILNAEIAWDSR